MVVASSDVSRRRSSNRSAPLFVVRITITIAIHDVCTILGGTGIDTSLSVSAIVNKNKTHHQKVFQ
jgi:hypothetical protein